MLKKKPAHKIVRSERALYEAWSIVRANGLASSSLETREEIKQFERNLPRNIQKIARQLRTGKFVFEPARGILLKKRSGGSRPVVKAPIPSRIVQRAILDVVQAIPSISSELKAGFNFGGVTGSGFGVPGAIAKALRASQQSAYYIRTDIKSFFVDVPRDIALKLILSEIDDPQFGDLLKQATDTELQDMLHLGESAKLFPLEEEGVAQGSCLSPLLCNYLLKDFDRAMNDRGIVCVRYIDDFIVFGSSRKATFKAFNAGLKLLAKLGLSAYNPESIDERERAKADHGSTDADIRFLGCDIRKDRVRPSDASKARLLKDIRTIFSTALGAMRDPLFAARSGASYAETIVSASHKIRGWGNTYSFCTDDQLMLNIDIQISSYLKAFGEGVNKRLRQLNANDKRRITGLWCLEDSNQDQGPGSTRAAVATYRSQTGSEDVVAQMAD